MRARGAARIIHDDACAENTNPTTQKHEFFLL